MKNLKVRHFLSAFLAISLNIFFLFGTVYSVITAINESKDVSSKQNIENVKTLTDASADKIEIVFSNFTNEIKACAKYINDYNQKGMTLDEIKQYFVDYYDSSSMEWELIDNTPNEEQSSIIPVFTGFVLNPNSEISLDTNVYYSTIEFDFVAKVFISASQDTLGHVEYLREFWNSHSLSKCFAITSTIRVLQEDDTYQYKTLMMMVKSDVINEIIQNNNQINTLTFFNFSNIIIDSSGDYVISNDYFQATNILKYIGAYNEITKEDKFSITEQLQNKQEIAPIYYQNNKNEDCVYTFSQITSTDWYVVSVVPLASFHNIYNNKNLLSFVLWMILLFILDSFIALVAIRQFSQRTNEAKKANQAKTDFLSSMSHDIRTPMNAIIGTTYIANKQLEEKNVNVDTLKECINSIQQSSNRLLTLVNDILDMSKIESGKISLRNEHFTLPDVIRSMIEGAALQIEDRKLQITAHLYSLKHEVVNADELRITQIYVNILSNAIKYTPDGGTITINLKELPSSKGPNYSVFQYQVIDTGIGMDEEFLKNIFNRFTRAVDTRINKIQGTGLGMAIVKQLVDLMHGDINIQSKLNEGSTFTISLELETVPNDFSHNEFKTKRCLVMDDDFVELDAINAFTNQTGLCTDFASTILKGLSLVKESEKNKTPYDYLFINETMEHIDCSEIIQQISEITSSLPHIVMMSAKVLSKNENHQNRKNINFTIQKPLYPSSIIKALHYVDKNLKVEDDQPAESFDNFHVLIAEDNKFNWLILSKILTEKKIISEWAENGKIAVEKASTNHYDFIFMDIQMPEMNGYEATKKIRALEDEEKRNVPIYAMSADVFSEDIQKCNNAGMNGHLSKPLNVEKVFKALQDCYNKNEK